MKTSDSIELDMYACASECEQFKTKGKLLCLLDKRGQLIISQFNDRATTNDTNLSFELTPLMIQNNVQNFWFGSCSDYVICQDMSQVMIVISTATWSVLATFPLIKQIRGLYIKDDLVIAALENGTLASLFIFNNQDSANNSKKIEHIMNM